MNLEKIRKKILNKEGGYKLLYLPFLFLSKLYCFLSLTRNKLYDFGILETKEFSLPVISVGNITAGGTGKTPLVESLYLTLEKLGFKPAIVTRGYKGKSNFSLNVHPDPERFGDEASIYALKGYKTIVSKNRVKGVEAAFRKGANVVILDDGFQHRRVKPSLNLLTIDPFNPFGDGNCLPLGLLREPLSGLERADAFIITRGNLVNERRLNSIELYIKTFKKPIFIGTQRFNHWINEKFKRTTPPEKEINVFCGIGNPGQFIEMLIQLGFEIKNLFIFEDHHKYTKKEIENLSKYDNLVTTEKDLIKIYKKSELKVKVPVLTLEVPGLKEYLINNVQNTVKSRENGIEKSIAPIGISTFEGKSLFSEETTERRSF